MHSIADILNQPGRDWSPDPPASEDAIHKLASAAKLALPEEYFSLLRYCNGGEGALGVEPYWLVLYPIAEVIDLNEHEFYRDEFPELFFIGGNGGGELLALQTARPRPWPIVMIDPIAGLESTEVVAASMAAFINAIGVETEDAEV